MLSLRNIDLEIEQTRDSDRLDPRSVSGWEHDRPEADSVNDPCSDLRNKFLYLADHPGAPDW